MRLILQITAGAGPVEAREFVGKLGLRLADELSAAGVVVDATVTRGDPPRTVQLRFDRPEVGPASRLAGTYALLAKSPRRGHDARKRWFASVALFEEAPMRFLSHRVEHEIRFTACRSGGPGGQHVNRTASAVIAEHVSGVRVRVEAERSQHQNRRRAVELIQRALADRHARDSASQRAHRRRHHSQVRRGAPDREFRLDRRGRLVEVRRAT